jgi:hypothetical protein
VFIVHDGRAERRAVTVSGSGDDQAIITSGLAAGEKVVLDAPAGLKEGAAVREPKPAP